jgi:hypothetical protein
MSNEPINDKVCNDPLHMIENLDFMQYVPEGASDNVITIAGLLHIVVLCNEKNKEILVPNNVVLSYGKVRQQLTTTEFGFLGEFWAHQCGVFEASTPYKEHEEKGKELINTLDRLLIDKLKQTIQIH